MILVLWVLVAAVAGALEIAADSAGTGAGIVVRVVLGVLTAPLPAVPAAVHNFHLRAAPRDAARAGGGGAPGPAAPDPFGGP